METFNPKEIAAQIGSDEFTVQAALQRVSDFANDHNVLFPHLINDGGERVATEIGVAAVAAAINNPGPQKFFLNWLTKQAKS